MKNLLHAACCLQNLKSIHMLTLTAQGKYLQLASQPWPWWQVSIFFLVSEQDNLGAWIWHNQSLTFFWLTKTMIGGSTLLLRISSNFFLKANESIIISQYTAVSKRHSPRGTIALAMGWLCMRAVPAPHWRMIVKQNNYSADWYQLMSPLRGVCARWSWHEQESKRNGIAYLLPCSFNM